jgi:dolichyl-phosphate-mannose-protein mannosyltransferase
VKVRHHDANYNNGAFLFMDQFWQNYTASEVFPQAFKAFCVVLILFGLFLIGLLPPKRTQPLASLSTQPWNNKDWLLAFTFAGLFYVLAIYRLDQPRQFVFDEIYHGRSGMQYLRGENPMEWTHPPLTKLLISVSLRLWRATFDPRDGIWQEHGFYSANDVIGWRFASCVFGALSLFVLYILARTLSKNRTVAIFATLFLACDGIFFVQSRIAMTNIFTVFFVLLAALGAFLFAETEKKRHLILLTIGLCGAVSTRWSTLIGVALIGIFLLWHTILPLLTAHKEEKKDWGKIIGRLLLLGLTVLVIPAAFYLITYIPYMRQGEGHSIYKVLEEQKAMWDYHSQLREGHPYSSPWWTWPLMLRPTWYYFDKFPTDAVNPEQIRGIWSIGNCFVWWATIPVLAFVAYFAVRNRSTTYSMPFRLIALLGLGQWLIWAVQPRTLIFTHYLFEAIPFVCIGLAWFGVLLWQKGGYWKGVIAYAVLTVLWWLFFYPLLSAYPVTMQFYGQHLWMGRLWT